MRSEKRWLKWVLSEATEMRIKMPWELNTRPVAFANQIIETTETNAA